MKRLNDFEISRAEDVHRQFGALMIGGKVENDGQVKGWRDWFNSLEPGKQEIYDRVAKAAAKKVVIDGRHADEVLAGAVTYCRRLMDSYRPEPIELADHRDVSKLIQTLGRGLAWDTPGASRSASTPPSSPTATSGPAAPANEPARSAEPLKSAEPSTSASHAAGTDPFRPELPLSSTPTPRNQPEPPLEAWGHVV